MQAEKFQKIKTQVQVSTFLTQPEKAEWLELMELMNDRQLLELEKILNQAEVSVKQPVLLPSQPKPTGVMPPAMQQRALQRTAPIAPEAAPISMLSQAGLKKPAPVPPVPVVPKQPPFSHILNLPKAQPHGESRQTPPVKKIDPAAKPAPIPVKKPNPFFSKLKNMFEEKELPSGEHLELPAPHFHPQVDKISVAALPKHPLPQAAEPKQVPVVKQNMEPQKASSDVKVEPKPNLPKVAAPVKHTEKHSQSLASHKKAEPKKEPKVNPHTLQAPKKQHDKQRDNVTINVVMQSPEDFSKLSGLVKGNPSAEQALKTLAQNSAAAIPAAAPSALPQVAPVPASAVPRQPDSELLAQAPVNSAPQPVPAVAAPANTTTTTNNTTNNVSVFGADVEVPGLSLEDMVQAAQQRTVVKLQEKAAEEKKYAKPEAAKTTVILNNPMSEGGAGAVMKAPVKPGEQQTADNVVPGLNFPELFKGGPVKLKFGQPADSAGSSADGAIRQAKIILEERPGDTIKLDTLNDVASLQLSDLQQHATGTIMRQLRAISGTLGYYDVMFSLEKSPLFKAYINTGQQLLKDQLSFEKQPPAAKGLLSKRDFEQFADLLIVVRSAF